MGQKLSVEEVAFNMKLKSRELKRMSEKCEKEEKSERLKVKKAIEKGNAEGAKIYAQNAIRKKHEALNYLKLSSKMDAVGSRLQAAHRSQQLTKDVFKAVPGLSKAMNSLDIETLSCNMDTFEKVFEDLDVRAEFVTNAIDSTTATATPIDQVEALIAEVAETHALDVSQLLSDAPLEKIDENKISESQPTASLDTRLKNLNLP